MADRDKDASAVVLLHERQTGAAIYVNPDYVTFITKSPDRNGGTIVGLVADDIGCEVRESPEEIVDLIGSPCTKTAQVAQPPPALETKENDRNRGRPGYHKNRGRKAKGDRGAGGSGKQQGALGLHSPGAQDGRQ